MISDVDVDVEILNIIVLQIGPLGDQMLPITECYRKRWSEEKETHWEVHRGRTDSAANCHNATTVTAAETDIVGAPPQWH